MPRKHTISARRSAPEYYVWAAIVQRCYNPNNPRFADYGGRGVTMCQEWRDSYEAFLRDMGRRPTPKHTIERRHNDVGYTPENTIWATMHAQSRNKRSNHRLTFQGKTQCIRDWSLETGLRYGTILNRIRDGWTVEETLTAPSRLPQTYTFQGTTLTLAEWAARYNMSLTTLNGRLKKGWTIEDSLLTPVRTSVPYGYLTYNGETLSIADWARRLHVQPVRIYSRIERGWTAEQALTLPPRRGKKP